MGKQPSAAMPEDPFEGGTRPDPMTVRVEAQRPRSRLGRAQFLPTAAVLSIALVATALAARGLVVPAAAGAQESEKPLALSVQSDGKAIDVTSATTVTVSVTNESSGDRLLAVDECGAVAGMSAAIALPAGSDGRSWDGIARTFKAYATKNGLGPGGIGWSQPLAVPATAAVCLDRPEGVVLGAGETIETQLTWTPELASGLPAPPGSYPFTVSTESVAGPKLGDGPPEWVVSKATGTVTVADNGQSLIGPASAIDALLGDERFVSWLSSEPDSSWSTVNIVLNANGTGEGIAPKGVSWEVDLFREHDVARSWAIGFVDPETGELVSLSFCNAPCDH
jgi:hypothetical protein